MGDEEDDGHGDETTEHGFGEDFFGIRVFEDPFRVRPCENGREECGDDGRCGCIGEIQHDIHCQIIIRRSLSESVVIKHLERERVV